MEPPKEDPRFTPRPIVLVTGATGAVGFGICLRLLYQLSKPIQSDLSTNYICQSKGQKYHLVSKDDDHNLEVDQDEQSIFATPNGVTLLIGCRSETKYKLTKIELEKELKKLIQSENILDQEGVVFSYIDRQTGQVESMQFQEYRSSWLNNLSINWVPLDLYQTGSVLECVRLVNLQYGYLTHLLLNAGGGPFVAIDWFGLIKAFLRNFRDAITYPDYLVQATNVTETIDGIPETWQLNVFSHYLLARESLELLSKGSKKNYNNNNIIIKARIIWTGSLDGQSLFFNRNDLECVLQTSNAYQSSKYQSELVGQGFLEIINKRGLSNQVVSLVAHPGIVAGNMFTSIIGRVMDTMMVWVFYFGRIILGSPHHLISGYLSAIVWTKLCLTEDPTKPVKKREQGMDTRSVRFGAQCNRWGKPLVVKEQLVEEDEVDNLLVDQRLVIHHCERKANALITLWAPS